VFRRGKKVDHSTQVPSYSRDPRKRSFTHISGSNTEPFDTFNIYGELALFYPLFTAILVLSLDLGTPFCVPGRRESDAVQMRMLNHSTWLFLGMARKLKRPGNGSIRMNDVTLEYGLECPDCLRWWLPVYPDDPCLQCERWGVPTYPNRVRYFAINQGISLREVRRRSGLSWSGLVAISRGRCAPHRRSRVRILRALGLNPRSRHDMKRVFPRPRRRYRRKPVAG
jgi:hypothetical protein